MDSVRFRHTYTPIIIIIKVMNFQEQKRSWKEKRGRRGNEVNTAFMYEVLKKHKKTQNFTISLLN